MPGLCHPGAQTFDQIQPLFEEVYHSYNELLVIKTYQHELAILPASKLAIGLLDLMLIPSGKHSISSGIGPYDDVDVDNEFYNTLSKIRAELDRAIANPVKMDKRYRSFATSLAQLRGTQVQPDQQQGRPLFGQPHGPQGRPALDNKPPAQRKGLKQKSRRLEVRDTNRNLYERLANGGHDGHGGDWWITDRSVHSEDIDVEFKGQIIEIDGQQHFYWYKLSDNDKLPNRCHAVYDCPKCHLHLVQHSQLAKHAKTHGAVVDPDILFDWERWGGM